MENKTSETNQEAPKLFRRATQGRMFAGVATGLAKYFAVDVTLVRVVTLNGEARVARSGETVIVPAGARHSEGNAGPADVEGVVELRPALRSKEFHEAIAGLVADGATTSRGAPKNPLQLGATFWHFRHESRVTSPPIWAQDLFLPPLWALARFFGVRPYYEHWDSRVPEIS